VCAAACGRAGSVLGLDSSESALALARAHAELNGVADRCRFERADVFAELPKRAQAGERFDVVILDPPKMARSRAGLQRALKAYLRLNRAAIELLGQGGILVSCSCSGLVDRDALEEVLSLAATEAGRSLQILETRGQAADHPVSIHCLETGYLKCYICRVL
ncbi:MAG TPA: methyltransferase domain-containing protein, partial [Planctomycetaceae bacterium]|nr:methyltransferase domain-containing protein [Planctomycetaceae bacterium]